MAKKKKSPCYSDLLHQEYARWTHIFNFGCTDPSYEDGVNIDLVRNHILHYKSECERVLKDNYLAYPDEYFYPDPIELPQDFMAVDRKAPILAGFKNIDSDIVPKKNYGLKITDCLKFSWFEAFLPEGIAV